MKTKKCRHCGQYKAYSEFNKRSNSKDGLQSYCRSCEKEKKKVYKKGGEKYHIKMANVNRNQERCKEATPPWSNKKEIQEVYDLCHRLAKLTKQPYHGGHIFPIGGRKVSGLNIAPNLQPELASVNLQHKNNFTPFRYCEGHYYELEKGHWVEYERPTWNPAILDLEIMLSSY